MYNIYNIITTLLLCSSLLSNKVDDFKKLELELGNVDTLSLNSKSLWKEAHNLYVKGSSNSDGFDLSVKLLKQSYDLFEQVGDYRMMGHTLTLLGYEYLFSGDINSAHDIFKSALSIFKKRNNKWKEANLLNLCGFSERSKGNYEAALTLGYNALKVAEEINYDYEISFSLSLLGSLYFIIGKNEKAKLYFKRSLDLQSTMEGVDISITRQAATMLDLGRAHMALNEQEEAFKYFNDASNLVYDSGESDNISNAYIGTQISLGSYYDSIGDFHKALELYKPVLDLSIKYESWSAAIIISNAIALTYQNLEDYDKLEEYLNEAFEFTKKTGSDLSDIHSNFGFLYYETGRDSLAIEYLSKSIEVYEETRQSLYIDSYKNSYMESRLSTYKCMIDLLGRNNQKEDLFNYIEKMKARTLLDILDRGNIDFSELISIEDIRAEDSLVVALERMNKIISGFQNNSDETLDSLLNKRNNIRKTLDQFKQNLYFKYPGLKEQSGQANPITLRRAQRMLNKNEAAIYYLPLQDQLLIVVITRKNIELISHTIDEEEINNAIDKIISGVNIKSLDWDNDLSQFMYSALIEPIIDIINKKEVLCIIPTGKLNYLPFQALQNQKGEYLIQNYGIYYTPSLSNLSWLRLMGTLGARGLLAFGDCDFDNKETFMAMRGDLTPLPGTGIEVDALENIYKPQAMIFKKKDATESNFKNNGSNYGIIHIATHAFVDDHNPMYSSIALSKEEEEDGFLEAREIMNMELNADLAVLSACNTAFGKQLEGEGMIGLSRAFFTAGVPSVVASLWSVEDNATKELMIQFHKRLRDGERPAIALKDAQNYLINNTQYTNPVFWSPFILIGDSE